MAKAKSKTDWYVYGGVGSHSPLIKKILCVEELWTIDQLLADGNSCSALKNNLLMVGEYRIQT